MRGACYAPPIARITVLPVPKMSQANPTRGSQSTGFVCLKPFKADGSVGTTIPFSGSPVPGTNERTRFAGSRWPAELLTNRGSIANEFPVGQLVPSGVTPFTLAALLQ